MFKKLILRLLPALLGASILFAPAFVSAAYDPFDGADCAKGSATAQSAVCKTDKSKSLTGSDGVIVAVTNFVAIIAGIAAVIILLVASIKYITSDGDPKEIELAKHTIIYAVVGILVVLFAKVVITYVVNKVS